MTTREIDDFFMSLKGVAQFVVGNCALAEHKKFFLNLSDAQKLDVLKKSGHPYKHGVVEKVPAKSKPGCPSSFGEDMSLEENKEWCGRTQGPGCEGCGDYAGEVTKTGKDKKASAPVQMGLW